MSNVMIPNLQAAIELSGSEQLEAVQDGVSVRITVDQIAALATAGDGISGAVNLGNGVAGAIGVYAGLFPNVHTLAFLSLLAGTGVSLTQAGNGTIVISTSPSVLPVSYTITGSGPYTLPVVAKDTYGNGTLKTYGDGILQDPANWASFSGNLFTIPSGVANLYTTVMVEYVPLS